MIVQKGEVYLVQLGEGTGSEQKGTRPCMIVQNNTGNKHSPTTMVALITSKEKKNKNDKHFPMHVPIKKEEVVGGGISENSLVLCEQIYTIDKERLIKRLGTCQDNKKIMDDMDNAIKVSFGL